jgi:hypothetical protein
MQTYKGSDLTPCNSAKKTTSSMSSTWTDSLQEGANKSVLDRAVVNFGVDLSRGEKPEKDQFSQSTPIASARSFSLKDETPSSSGSQWPSEPAIATEKIGGIGFSSTFKTESVATQSRTVVKSELVAVGTGNDKVLFSQGLLIGSKATENVTFDGPETLKVTETDISLQKEEKNKILLEKQTDANSSTNCYKGCLWIISI